MGQSQFPPTIVRVYKGAQQSDAIHAFQRDAAKLAEFEHNPSLTEWPGDTAEAAAPIVPFRPYVS
jgi:hypothetical protein